MSRRREDKGIYLSFKENLLKNNPLPDLDIVAPVYKVVVVV